MKHIISKKQGWKRYWDCIIMQDGVSIRALIDEADVLEIELKEKLEKFLPGSMNQIFEDLDRLLQSKYYQALNDEAESKDGE